MAYNPRFSPKNINEAYGRNSLLIFVETEEYEHLLVSEDYALAKHEKNSPCQLESCKQHLLLYHSSIDTIWERLGGYKFRYHLANDIYAYFKFMISLSQTVQIGGNVMQTLKSAIEVNRRMKYMEYRPSVWRKAIAKRSIRTFNIRGRDVGVQTLSKHLDTRIITILNGPRAADFLKTVDCFYDGHGSIISNSLSLVLK